ncbi:MAG: hypothetical protein A2Z88_03325 [Omnitrophica WOR_2 bacterium GWA2_47_8]|nr:MAG: hypothetical protein A2Z88_03325 [Omnitrophica WOR_2 bacterium GWA2_47_8]
MNKKILATVTFFLLIFFIAETCHAGLINYQRRNRRGGAPAPAGGKASPAAAPVQKTMAKWMQILPSVTNQNEQRYDVNNDGKLQTAEVKTYLRDVLNVIDSKGGFTVNSEILKEYDKNKDGLVTREEARLLREHVAS